MNNVAKRAFYTLKKSTYIHLFITTSIIHNLYFIIIYNKTVIFNDIESFGFE